MEKQRKTLAVVMQRRPSRNRWESVVWEPWSVLESDEPAGAPRLLVEQDGIAQWLHPGIEIRLVRDEAEGYYLNVASPEPSVFVMWRVENEQGVPLYATVSYEEASRWMDGGAQIDRVGMPAGVYAWAGAWVEANYRPEPRKRNKPRSFLQPKDRGG